MVLNTTFSEIAPPVHPSRWVKADKEYNMWCSIGTVGGVKAQRMYTYLIHEVKKILICTKIRELSKK